MQAENINHIRFTTISPETVKKMSVARLIVPDTYNDEGYPIDGGLIDQRLGVIDPGLRCKTCGGRVKSCPGHFGHIELVRPVIHPEFAKTIYSLLQSTCSSCHRILATPEKVEEVKSEVQSIVSTEDEEAKALVLTNISDDESRLKIKRPKYTKKCPHCGNAQRKLRLERPTFFSMDGNSMKPDEIRDWLTKISDDDLRLLGMDPDATRPEWFIITVLLVSPVNVRPSITLESGERSEDDLTHKLVDIMRINQRLEQDIDAGAPQIIIDDLWELLQYQVTTYFNNETPGIPVARHRSTRPLKTLAQRLKGKEGRLRYNLSGKRVNFSARTVISPDSSLTINQVGVPKRFAEVLTIPIYVTKWNLEEAKRFLENKEYPTVLNVLTKDGLKKRVTEVNREELLKAVEPGYILERQLIEGDIGLMNRQPTLHRPSIMAHTIKILPGRTMRIHVTTTLPYNADFDGDEMNLHIPQTLEAQAESRYLMQPKDAILSPRDGKPLMALHEDEVIGMYLLTRDGAMFSKREACALLARVGIDELPDTEKGSYSGKGIFSMLLPKDLDYEAKLGSEKITIKGGVLRDGTVSEKFIREGSGTLILKVFEQYGSEFTKELMFKMSVLSVATTAMMGITTSVRDYYKSVPVEKELSQIVAEARSKVEKLYINYKDGKLEALPGFTRRETLEAEVMAELDSVRSQSAKVLNKHVSPAENNVQLMAAVKARGNILNFVQTSMLLGQQAVRGKRPSRGYSGRVLPYFARNEKLPEAKGFVTSSFFSGLRPAEFFMHAMGSRDSQMSKSLVIAQSGYLQRRLINAMQDFYIGTDLSVRDASGVLIQTIYGGDGIDPTKERMAKGV